MRTTGDPHAITRFSSHASFCVPSENGRPQGFVPKVARRGKWWRVHTPRDSSAMPRAFSPAEIEDFFARLKKTIPEPKTELQSLNPYTLLVAVVLSAQATDKSVNKAAEPLFRIADTPEKMIALCEAALIGYIKTIGLYRTKARNVIALSRLLADRHGGKVPNTRAELEALPGAGRKTANVVLNVAFGQKTIAVDTHIFRVCNRTHL